MRRGTMIAILLLGVAAAFSAEAARSEKLKSGGKRTKDAVAGMRAYTPEQIAVYNRGVTALELRDYPQARKGFEAALALNDEFPEAHNNLAFSLRSISLENSEASLKHYARALELEPKFARALFYRGVLFVELGRTPDAEKDRAALLALGTAESKKFAGELAKIIKAGKAKPAQSALSAYPALAQ